MSKMRTDKEVLGGCGGQIDGIVSWDLEGGELVHVVEKQSDLPFDRDTGEKRRDSGEDKLNNKADIGCE